MPKNQNIYKENDFERCKGVLFSVRNKQQLVSAVNYINNFNKKYKITEKSPEYIYFEKMISLMSKKIKSKFSKNQDDDVQRRGLISDLELEESLNWTDNDESYGSDGNFSPDPYWKNYENGSPSYWEQGDAGGSSDSDGDMNESNDFDWIKDIEELPIPGTAWIMEINQKDSEEVQQKLFDVGFRWSSGGNKIDETSGVYAFVSYSNYDIKYKGFKKVKGDSYISNNINNIISSVQPNDLFIYEYKDGTSRLKNTSLNESNDFDWTKDVESLDNRGFYVGDEFIDTDDVEPIKYTIKNIVNDKVLLTWFSPYDNQDVEYVDSLNRLESRLKDGFIEFVNELNEDFDWIKDIQPETEWDKEKYYVLDVRSLSGVKLRETIDDIWDFAYNMDYDVEIGVEYNTVGYVYFEPNDEVPEGYALDWSPRKTTDPTFGGKYQMISLEEFYHMAYGDEPLNESNDFDWTSEIKPMKPEMEWLKSNFDNLKPVIKGGRTFYVDSERKPLFMYKQDSENGYVWINQYRIWMVLRDDFGLSYGEIQELITRWLDETYNLRGFTPRYSINLFPLSLDETYNLRGFTPNFY